MAIPGKIVMKGTGTMSLNDRFTIVSKTKAAGEQRQLGQMRSQRVMQQMENRPVMMAALNSQPKKNVMQRLGVRARLGYFGYNKPVYYQQPRRGNFGYRGRGGFAPQGFIPYWKRGGFRPTGGYWNPYRGRGRVFRGGIQKSYRGGGRGGFRNGFSQPSGRGTEVAKERLDKELDAYMSQGVRFNNTLDALMAEVQP